MASGRRLQAGLETLLGCVGIVCLAATVAAFGGRLSERLDLLANFAPLWLGAACAVFTYGVLFARFRRRLILATGGLATLMAGTLMAPEFIRPIPTAPHAARTLRIIQFNTWDENTAVPATADWIAAQKPDIVVTEEAEAPLRIALAARGFVVTRGFGHTAIFSRERPIQRPALLMSGEWHSMPPFVRATYANLGVGEFTVVGAHVPQPIFGISAPERLMLARMLRRYDPRRLIVAGDFNLAPWSFALRDLDGSLGLTRLDQAVWSWPATVGVHGWRLMTVPFLPIDHIYAGPAWTLVRLRRGPSLGSDHFPLVVDLAERG